MLAATAGRRGRQSSPSQVRSDPLLSQSRSPIVLYIAYGEALPESQALHPTASDYLAALVISTWSGSGLRPNKRNHNR